MSKHDKSHITAVADDDHPHPAWRTARPPLDEAEINSAAMADMDTLFTCWMRNGEPSPDVRQINPDAPTDRKIRHFHVVHRYGVWATDLGGGGGQFRDPISVLEFLADCPRRVAALYLRSRLEAAAYQRNPPGKSA